MALDIAKGVRMRDCYGRPDLSARALCVWAKTAFSADLNDHRYLRLWQHMRDTAAISELLWKYAIAEKDKKLLCEDLGGETNAVSVLTFLAMVHDVGKASPAFEVQNDYFADRVRESGLHIPSGIAHTKERSQYRHELVGYKALLRWASRQKLNTQVGSLAHGLASIVAGHHGTCITDEKKRLLNSYDATTYVGDADWEAVRMELVDWAAGVTDFQSTIDRLNNRPIRSRSQALLTGMVIESDWIASDSRLFPLNDGEADELGYDSHRRSRRAWRLLALPRPWEADTSGLSPDDLFASRFDLSGARLRPMQREAVDLASTMEKPGLMIIEANMGEGKTEAALTAAEILASRFHCGGIYYALPTRATVNAMFHRALQWIGHLPAQHGMELGSVFLAQAKHDQNPEYVRLREEWFDDPAIRDKIFSHTSFGYVDDEYSQDSPRERGAVQAVVNSWLTGPKRGNLSDFVIGTIDQVLMAALQSKHVVLRHLALSGKVVILDEVHSNTAYMNVYMENALSWLGAYEVPVIMLSATLPQDRREAFLRAYKAGAHSLQALEGDKAIATQIEKEQTQNKSRAWSLPMRHSLPNQLTKPSAGSGEKPSATKPLDLRYPLISLVEGDGIPRSVSPAASGRAIDVQMSLIDDSDEALVALLRKQLHESGCAVVIRNTVSRAQHTFDLLQKEFGSHMDVLLDHARFLACDRSDIDQNLLLRFGKSSTSEMRQGIVVATQVVEQSLDVDFDMMITDVAPADLILQRAGRLHRHRRGEGESERPEPLRQARMYITGVTWNRDAAPGFSAGITRVYQPFFLLRTLAMLGIEPDRASTVNLPGDISRLVQSVYEDGTLRCRAEWREVEIEAHAALMEHLADSRSKARVFSLMAPQRNTRHPFALDDWLTTCISDVEGVGDGMSRQARAAVRDGDDSFEVIVLQQDADGTLMIPEWVSTAAPRRLPQGFDAPTPDQVQAVLACTISLGSSSVSYLNLDAVINAIEFATPATWHVLMQQERLLSGQLPLILDHNGETTLQVKTSDRKGNKICRELRIRYSPQKGWEAHVNRK